MSIGDVAEAIQKNPILSTMPPKEWFEGWEDALRDCPTAERDSDWFPKKVFTIPGFSVPNCYEEFGYTLLDAPILMRLLR